MVQAFIDVSGKGDPTRIVFAGYLATAEAWEPFSIAWPGLSVILSTALMLDWLAERHGSDDARLAARAIETSIDRAFGEGRVRSHDIGGSEARRGGGDPRRRSGPGVTMLPLSVLDLPS
jgi:hypothetical protein